jgi:hypothetical protein
VFPSAADPATSVIGTTPEGYDMKSMFWALAAVLAAGSGCVGGEDIGSTESALTPVTWQNAIRVTATGDDLIRPAGPPAWDAGASSVESLSGDGFVEFTTAENNLAKMVGLSNGDTDAGYADIDFAIYLKSTGNVGVYEGGVLRNGNFGSYLAGDLFRIEVAGAEVSYQHNGAVFYTSTIVPSFPLLVDTSLRNQGATVQNVNLESLDFWQNVIGASAVGNDLTRTSTLGGWNSGASSIRSLSGDGYLAFSTAENTTNKLCGLSNGDSDQSYADIDFAIDLRENGVMWIYEGGVRLARVGTYVAGDMFKVDVTGGVVTYWKNGALLYTSTATVNFPLVADTALLTNGATITDASLTE